MGDTLSPQADLTAYDRLVLVRIKIERAKKHLVDLEREVRKWRRYQSKAVRLKDNLGSTHKITTTTRISFEAVSIAGDVIQNLRTALDHLAYQLVLVAGKRPSKYTAFPIYEDVTAYRKGKARKVKGMRPEAKKFIDTIKPYGGGNDILVRLSDLNNIDKHRVFLTIGKEVIFHADWINSTFDNTFLMKASDPNFVGVFGGKTENDMNLEITKALTQPQVSKGDTLIPSLHQMVQAVERLIESFYPLLER
jgi:hypothetical protein